MRIKNAFMKVFITCFNMIAMLMVAQTANSACMWIAHQPEFPEEAKKFKKVV